MNWKDVGTVASKVAPILGGVLGGPVGLIATGAGALLANFLGVEATPEAVDAELKGNPEAMLKLKEFELKEQDMLYQWHAKQLDAEIEDRKSARQRDVALVQAKGNNTRGDVLAFAAIGGLVALLYTLLFVEIPPTAEKVFLILAGGLIAIVKDVYGFEFGSSRGSKAKDSQLTAR